MKSELETHNLHLSNMFTLLIIRALMEKCYIRAFLYFAPFLYISCFQLKKILRLSHFEKGILVYLPAVVGPVHEAALVQQNMGVTGLLINTN